MNSCGTEIYSIYLKDFKSQFPKDTENQGLASLKGLEIVI